MKMILVECPGEHRWEVKDNESALHKLCPKCGIKAKYVVGKEANNEG